MGGLPSKVTNDSIFRTLFPAKISCHVPENPKVPQAHAELLLSYIKFLRVCMGNLEIVIWGIKIDIKIHLTVSSNNLSLFGSKVARGTPKQSFYNFFFSQIL